jgi:hypothetical protein
MSVGELVAALQIAREVGDARQPATGIAVEGMPVAEAAAAAEENVTTLSAARHTK